MNGRRTAVAWVAWTEWQGVHEGLFSSDLYAQQRSVSRVASWRSRMQLPVAINATAQLVELQLHESMAQQHHHAIGVSSRSHMELSLLYSSIIVRCVNGLVDSSQKGPYALAVSTLAQRIGIPLWIVDLRHESTHNQLPFLPVLRFAARHLLAWLRVNYWEAQEDLIRGQVHRLGQWLFDELPHLKKEPTGNDQQGILIQDNTMQLDTASTPRLDADTLRNIVVPLLVDGQQYGESVASTGLLFLEAPLLQKKINAKKPAIIFQRDTFVCLLLRLQPLWRRLSATLLARLCHKVLNYACPLKSLYSSDNEMEPSIQDSEEKRSFKQSEMEMTLQWIKFMVSSEYRERVRLQIGPIEDLCHCGAEMLALVDTLKCHKIARGRAELLERLQVALKSSRAIRNYSALATEATNGSSLASDSASGWTQLPAWTECPIGLCYSYASVNQFQICEYSLDDDTLIPDSSTFVTFDEEEEQNTNKVDADDVIDALMEDLDAAYDATLQQTLALQATIARDGLQQGGSTTVLPTQELQRIQEEIEIW